MVLTLATGHTSLDILTRFNLTKEFYRTTTNTALVMHQRRLFAAALSIPTIKGTGFFALLDK